MKYDNDAQEARRAYQAGRHNSENNKFRHTPLYTISELGSYVVCLFPGSKKQAEKYLTKQYGRASERTSYWWIRFASITPPVLLSVCRTLPWLNPKYVLKNFSWARRRRRRRGVPSTLPNLRFSI